MPEGVLEFDYVVINDDLEHAYRQIEAVLDLERRRVARIPDIRSHALGLRGDIEALLRED